MARAYYFDAWAVRNALADDPGKPWARKDDPTHLTLRVLEQVPQRDPVCAWRDDSPDLMARQIDLPGDRDRYARGLDERHAVGSGPRP